MCIFSPSPFTLYYLNFLDLNCSYFISNYLSILLSVSIVSVFILYTILSNEPTKYIKKIKYYINKIPTTIIIVAVAIIIILLSGVDTGCFRQRYAHFGHTNLGVPKFNPY